jgi:hypothetical protein
MTTRLTLACLLLAAAACAAHAWKRPLSRPLAVSTINPAQIVRVEVDGTRSVLHTMGHNDSLISGSLASNGTHVFWRSYYTQQIYALDAVTRGAVPVPLLSDKFAAQRNLGNGQVAFGAGKLFFEMNGSMIVSAPEGEFGAVTPTSVSVVATGLPRAPGVEGTPNLLQYTYSDWDGRPSLYCCISSSVNQVWRLTLGSSSGWKMLALLSGTNEYYSGRSCATSPRTGITYFAPISDSPVCEVAASGDRKPGCSDNAALGDTFYPKQVTEDSLVYGISDFGRSVLEVFAGNLTVRAQAQVSGATGVAALLR